MTSARDLITAVVDAAAYSPRNRQATLGPSEIGNPCNRFLAYKTVGAKKTWNDADPWASIVGTAVHAWLATAYAATNLALDEPRWLPEQRVYPHPGYPGSCDLYDLHDDDVIDHKIVGVTTLRTVKKNGPSQQYRIQGQLYGLGWQRMGRTPRDVIIAFWPRSGPLVDLYLYREPYDPQIALDALARVANVSAGALTLQSLQMSLEAIPATPGEACTYCPYKSIREGDGGCPDAPKPEVPKPRGRVTSLSL